MKRVFSFCALAALMATMSACERHPWSQTQQFFKPHGAGGHDTHGGESHAKEAGHKGGNKGGNENGHGAPAADAHGHKDETKSFFPEKKEGH